MKIAITGGKGGTGKSTVSTSLAAELAKKYRVMLVDADVECPNDHIILPIKRGKIKDVKAFLPGFNQDKCIKCGKCAEACKENAIIMIKDRYPFLLDEQCIGCRACIMTCPNDAIEENKQIIGGIYLGKPEFNPVINENLILVSGEIEIGFESSSQVVNATCDFASTGEDDYDILLIDTAAGTHCNVIAALMDVDMVLAVSEPTPLGQHDLELILKLLKILNIKSEIIVNKSDIGDLNLINEISDEYGIKIISEIPYTEKIINNYSKGIIITHEKISEIANALEQLL